jgi:D-alanyl-D-alanine carboxypeptidase
MERVTGRPLHEIYREIVFGLLGMGKTWLEGHEPALVRDVAHHYHGDIDMTTLSPTIDWAAGGLVTTAPDLARFVRGLWSEAILDSDGLEQLTRWTPGASFPGEASWAAVWYCLLNQWTNEENHSPSGT